jgi:hypothetical protein
MIFKNTLKESSGNLLIITGSAGYLLFSVVMVLGLKIPFCLLISIRWFYEHVHNRWTSENGKF